VGGLAIPYGLEQTVTDDGGVTLYFEEVAPGSFARDVTKGGRWVNLMVGHAGDDGERFLGRCVQLEDREDGLWPWFRLDREHPRAEEARSGELTGWSVAARVYRSREVRRGSRTVLVREQLGLSHVAATPRPQYAGAGVAIAREHKLVPAEATPNLDRWRARGYGRPVTTSSRHPA
jgi:HK97 family phage prohead protease